MAIVAWVLTAIFHENFVGLFSSVGTAFVVVPIIFIFLSGVLEMQSASSNITAMNEIANNTITRLIDFLGNNIPEILVSDLAGTFVGVTAGLFTGKNR
jgi:hypothetical protein